MAENDNTPAAVDFHKLTKWMTGYAGQAEAAILIIETESGETWRVAMPVETANAMGAALAKVAPSASGLKLA